MRKKLLAYAYDDGGRAADGRRRGAHDSLVRAVAISEKKPYRTVHDDLMTFCDCYDRDHPRMTFRSLVGPGATSKIVRAFMAERRWVWIPMMRVGSRARVHLRRHEIPHGRVVARISKQYTAVVDGVLRDLSDTSRAGNRCVYGVYVRPDAE
jgi:hypothetical protein